VIKLTLFFGNYNFYSQFAIKQCNGLDTPMI